MGEVIHAVVEGLFGKTKQLRMINYELRIGDYGLLITNYGLQITARQSLLNCY